MDRILIVLQNIFRQISKCKRGDLVPCGRHPCLLIKREEMTINSEKHKLLTRLLPIQYTISQKAQKLFGNNLAVAFLKFSDVNPINQSILEIS